MMPRMDETQESEFTRELQAHRRALESEYKLEDLDSKTTVEIAYDARKLFYESVPQAARTIIDLSRHAESETVRLTASKFIYEQVEKLEGKEAADPVKQLLRELTAA